MILVHALTVGGSNGTADNHCNPEGPRAVSRLWIPVSMGNLMAIVVGDRDAPQNFLNYALQITRKNLTTGERLEVEHFKLTKPFVMGPLSSTASLGRVIQGAADGSEATLGI